jgi:itaconyl-CoA hydratase
MEEVTRDVGDALYAESICAGARASGSRPGLGIVSMRTRSLNDGTEITSWYRSVIRPNRLSGIGQGYFPVAVNGPLDTDVGQAA